MRTEGIDVSRSAVFGFLVAIALGIAGVRTFSLGWWAAAAILWFAHLVIARPGEQ